MLSLSGIAITKKVHQKEKAASDSGVCSAGLYQGIMRTEEIDRFQKLTSATRIARGHPLVLALSPT